MHSCRLFGDAAAAGSPDRHGDEDDSAQEGLFKVDVHVEHGQAVAHHGQYAGAAEEADWP